MRNNALTILIVCAFVAVCFNIALFNIQAFKSIQTAINPNQSVNLTNICEILPYEECSSSAKAMCLLEKNSGRILYGKNIDEKLAMASTTKIFTALTVLNNCNNLDEKVNIDDRAVGIEGTSIYLRKGEVLTVKELLFGMMLPSGNDAATALAYHIGGEIDKFCLLMQETALNAGAKNSSFKNPHGLDEEGHYTTAYDLAKVSAEALKNETFREIVGTKFTTISGNDEVETRFLRNKNKLLSAFDGTTGVKTGFTDNAGRCFVSSAERNNMEVVCAVLNCGPMFEECANLMQRAFNQYKLYELLPAYNIVDNIPVEKGKMTEVKVYSRKSFCFPLTTDEFLQITYDYEKPQTLKAPVKKEQIVGFVKIYLGEQILFQDDLITTDEIKSNSIFQNVKDIFGKWR